MGAGRLSGGSAGTADPPWRSRQQARYFCEPKVGVTVLSVSTGAAAGEEVLPRVALYPTSPVLHADGLTHAFRADCGKPR